MISDELDAIRIRLDAPALHFRLHRDATALLAEVDWLNAEIVGLKLRLAGEQESLRLVMDEGMRAW